MPFTAHLAELRSCLIKSFVAVGVGFLVCYAYAEAIFALLTAPLLRVKIANLTLIGTAVSEAFFTKMKVAFVAGVFLASPVLLQQAWRFVAPGLYEHEKRYARGFVLFGTLFFFLGAGFCYEVVFQMGYRFFLKRYEAIGVTPAIRIGEYLSFSAKLLLAFGATFELPVVVYFLTRVGLVNYRFLIREFRYAVVIILILAAILAPPDIVSHVLLSFPLFALYGVSIGVAYLFRKKSS